MSRLPNGSLPQGIAAFVLKYRPTVDGYKVPAALLDAARAMRMVRSHAAEARSQADWDDRIERVASHRYAHDAI